MTYMEDVNRKQRTGGRKERILLWGSHITRETESPEGRVRQAADHVVAPTAITKKKKNGHDPTVETKWNIKKC